METQNGTKVEIPAIKPEVMRSKDDERKGAGAGLLSKLGLGGASAGGAGGFGAGGGGLLAGKAGIVALVLAGSSVAAGIGLFTMSGGFGERPAPSSSFFAKGGGSGGGSGDSADPGAPAAGEVSSSLDNFHQANRGAVPDPYAPAKPEEVKDSAGAVQASPTQPGDNTTTALGGTKPPAAPLPKMVKNAGFGSASGGSSGAAGGGGVQTAGAGNGAANLSRGAAGGTLSSFRTGSAGNAVQRRSSIMRGGGGGATSQLRAHGSTLKGNMGSGNISSAGSGAVMDGAGHGGNIGGGPGGIAGGGQGSGGKGIDSSPGKSTSENLKDVKAPPTPDAQDKGEDKTPYKKMMTAGIVAIGLALALLLVLGFIKKKIDALKPAAGATGIAAAEINKLLLIGKIVAGAATAAAAVATAMGLSILQKFPTEKMPGMILTAIGGFLTLQAGYKFVNLLGTPDPKPDADGTVSVEKAKEVSASFEGFSLMKTLGLGAAS